ncbi:MAG: hypothetical protein K2N73_11035 [Lachnospiraceae bacterium]|nr:hypothetical protein [Lachnospiraceae bacterium]
MNNAEGDADALRSKSSGMLENAYIAVIESSDLDSDPLRPEITQKMLSGKTAGNNSKNNNYMIKIQFNPSTLSFTSHDISRQKKKADISKKEQGEVETALSDCPDAAINVSFKLVYDRTIYEDSNVQPDVEKFIALATNPFVRQVIFCWGEMVYKGIVKNVDAEYVLFNALGKPTRAYVNLTIQEN